MIKRVIAVVLLIVGIAGTAGYARAAGDPVRGEQVYQRCAGCHSLDANRVGPRHRGVYGRRAGGVDGYRYSPALQRAEIVWDEESLDAWLANPGKFLPGSRMGYRLKQARDRADIIAFLRRESGR